MKVRLLVPREIAGELLEAGQGVIVSDDEGAALVAAGAAEALDEAALGGFAVPMVRGDA
jgi:hypothetical protein